MNEQEMNNTSIKLPLKTKIGYGFGELGSQCSWTLISSYLTVFYTDVVGLTPAIISAIMLIARIWDAVNDPMFGSIAENTKTKWGRFRPYILWGAPVLALFNCLTFLNLDIPTTWKSIWCGGAGEGENQTKGGAVKNLLISFKYTFQDRNAVMMVMAMFLFLTGIFGRLGIMAYYFIYVMANPGLIARFATAMSAGMLAVNFYAPFLLNHIFFLLSAFFFTRVNMTNKKAKENEKLIAQKTAAGEL